MISQSSESYHRSVKLPEFIAKLDAGLHEDNLRVLIGALTPPLKSATSHQERTILYVVQAVLHDTFKSWIEGLPVETAWLRQIEESITPHVKDAIGSLSRGPDAQVEAMSKLVAAYLALHGIRPGSR